MSDDITTETDYWANTDYPYQCLIDRARTTMLIEAVRGAVRPGDVVVEAGSGSGVLSLAAAAAGARRVVAAETNPTLAATLRQAANMNGFGSVIEVHEADVRHTDLPKADLVIAELIDTGLIDETLVPVLNRLHASGTITHETRLLPAAYRTELQLAHADNSFYGFEIPIVRHEWPHYSGTPRWVDPPVRTVGAIRRVWETTFRTPVDTAVKIDYDVELPRPADVNAVRISGQMLFGSDWRTAYPSLNAPKLLPVRPVRSRSFHICGSWVLGAGLATTRIEVIPTDKC